MALEVEPSQSPKRISFLKHCANGHGLRLSGTEIGNSWQIMVTGKVDGQAGEDPEYYRSLGQATTKLAAMDQAVSRWMHTYANPEPEVQLATQPKMLNQANPSFYFNSLRNFLESQQPQQPREQI